MAARNSTTASADETTTPTPEEIAAAAPNAVADPAPATALDEASGAIMEPEITTAVDVSHESVDANPRIGTTALQNGIDFNDAKRASPSDPAFAGQGIDRSVYGRPQATDEDGADPAATGTKSPSGKA